MKISEKPGQLVIDNSLAMQVSVGVTLALGGIGIIVLGTLNHIKWLWLVGAALVIVGALVAFFVKATRIVLAKSGMSSISSQRLFSDATSQSFALGDVTAVHLVTSTRQVQHEDASGNQRLDTQVSSTIYLHTRDGQRIALGSHTRGMDLGGMVGALVQSMPLKKEAERIAGFAGVPLQAHDALRLGGAHAT